MPKQKITPFYVFFYILFSPDTYRILTGILLGIVFMPRLLPQDTTIFGRYVLFIMLVGIGWAVSGIPARWIARKLQSLITKP
ncbi:MAG: hypothetical protein ACOWWM_12205 [Desulfobacterales bacterium]